MRRAIGPDRADLPSRGPEQLPELPPVMTHCHSTVEARWGSEDCGLGGLQRGAEKTRRGAAWCYDRTRLQPRMSGARTGGALAADRLDVGASRRMSQGGQSEGLSVVLR